MAAVLSSPLASAVDLRGLADAQADAAHEFERLRGAGSSLLLQDLRHPQGFSLLCDVSYQQPRPVVPSSWRRRVFEAVHGLAHPAARTTLDLVRRQYVWFRMASDVRQWARECLPCQRAKIHTHVRAPLEHRPPPDRRFGSLHVDLVGPLPDCQGYRYLFTIIDRWTRWMEAVPCGRCWLSTAPVPWWRPG